MLIAERIRSIDEVLERTRQEGNTEKYRMLEAWRMILAKNPLLNPPIPQQSISQRPFALETYAKK